LNAEPPNEALKDLASLLGDQATREIVELFLRDFPDSIHSLVACNRDDQMRISHGLRNSALHMGSELLTKRMGAIEDRLRKNGAPVTSDEVTRAMSDFDDFAVELRRYAAA
jgi:hypothetical protein